MVKIKPIDKVQSKFAEEVGRAGPEYEYGVRNPKADWATEAAGAEPRWIEGVTDAGRRKLYSAGVRKTGTPGWQTGAVEKGVSVYPSRASAAAPKFGTEFGKYHGIIARTDIGPRFAAGDPRNLDRVRKITEALHKGKIGGAASPGA